MEDKHTRRMNNLDTRRDSHSLALLILGSFVASFLAARTFTTLLPNAIVTTSGIHFHHFWYGLAMVAVSGLLAIMYPRPSLERIYALVFGLGSGLIGDEIGLLLTFRDYTSSLTFVFFTAVLAFSGIGYILVRYRMNIAKDLRLRGPGRSVEEVGLVIAGLSAVAFAFNYDLVGLGILASGGILAFAGVLLHRKIAKS